MDILTLDMECFYDNEYTLSKMSTEAYLRDPRMEEILWGIKWNDSASFWVLPDRAAHFFKHEVDWANTTLLHHHAHFDAARLAWAHGVKPALILDTLSMARIIDGPKAGNSLHDLCVRHLQGRKGDYVTYAKGKHLADFSAAELHEYGQYCCNDCDRTYDLAQIFIEQLPYDELRLIDLTVRMFTEPVFEGDVAKLRAAVQMERERKWKALAGIGMLCPRCKGSGNEIQVTLGFSGPEPCKECEGSGLNKKPLNSNDQFAALLRELDVEPEMKPSPTVKDENGSPKMIFAFARTDPQMQALVEDSDEDVAALAAARLAVKSNIVETRAEKFAACAERGPMPVYLSHGGAHTSRPSGGDGMNWLNMSKQNATRPEMMVLRQSIKAPPGYKIIAPDSGQGEARILAWEANQTDLVEAFAQGRDIYSETAADIYRRLINRKRIEIVNGKETLPDYIPGQVGKICELSFGFGSGWETASKGFLKGVLGAPPIQFTKEDMDQMQLDPSRFLNDPKKVRAVDAMPSRLELNDRLMHCAVTWGLIQRYRQRRSKIKEYWNFLEGVINAMIFDEEIVFGAHGIMRTVHEGIVMPDGLIMRYRGLERDDHGDATYWDGRKRTHIYGSLVGENLTQRLHRIVVAEQMLKIADAGIKIALWPYDEVVAVVPDDAAELALQFMVQTMKEPPAWAVGLPLTAEGSIGDTYADC